MRSRPLFCLLLMAAAGLPPVLANPESPRQDLARVQSRLQAVERELREQAGERDRAQSELRAAELAEADARRSVAATRRELAAARSRLQQLEADVAAARAALAAERARLETQLRLAYMSGREEWLRVLLSQPDPSALGRQLVYYQYLARQRGELMGEARQRAVTLADAMAEVEQERTRLETLEAEEASRLAVASAARQERAVVLARLDKDIAGGRNTAERLRAQAAELERTVQRLAEAMASMPAPGTAFGARKGKMAWPAEGTAANRFGQARSDGRPKWDGIVLDSPAGTEVRAIHDGRLVFADWLPGLGLLAVLDHGDGYMSLYGHNRDLARQVGEQVRAGELLGHVGDTGGLTRTGLYFEIRKNGRPVDPLPWISK